MKGKGNDSAKSTKHTVLMPNKDTISVCVKGGLGLICRVTHTCGTVDLDNLLARPQRGDTVDHRSVGQLTFRVRWRVSVQIMCMSVLEDREVAGLES